MLPFLAHFLGIYIILFSYFFPQNNINPNLPGILMGSIAMVAGFFVFILPETTGKPLPDTIAEVEAEAKKEKQNK